MSSARLAAFASIVLLGATPALAAGDAAQGLIDIKDLNLIVLGNMSGGQDVEGKTFVGGSLTNGGTFGIGRSSAGFAPSSWTTLTVGGGASGNININNGNNGAIANGITPPGAGIFGNAGTVNLNANSSTLVVTGDIGSTNGGNGATILAGGSLGSNSHPTGTDVEHGLGSTFSAAANAIAGEVTTIGADVKALMTTLNGLPATAGSGVDLHDPNSVKFTAVDSGAGYAVIDINATDLESARTVVFNLQTLASGYLPTVINVINNGGGAYAFNFNDNNNPEQPYVIWNFGGATSLNFGSQMEGSVLAAYADVHNTTPIEGTLVAASFEEGGEVHLGTYAGGGGFLPTLSPPPPPPPPPPIQTGVPEPATWGLMLVGFAGLGALMRRNRRRMPAL